VSAATYRQKPRKQEDIVIYPERLRKQLEDHDKANIEYIIQQDDHREMEYEDAARLRPDTERKFVRSIYRVKTQKKNVEGQQTDEALYYHLDRICNAYSGKSVAYEGRYGARMIPITTPIMDEHGRVKRWDKTSEYPYFEMPFSVENFNKLLELSGTKVEQFYLVYASQNGPEPIAKDRYQIWNKDDFLQGTFEELWDMSSYNYTTRQSRLKEWRIEGEPLMKQARNMKSISNRV